MKTSNLNQIVPQDDSQRNTYPKWANTYIKCVSPMTYSQKLYQLQELQIAQEYEQALEANSLEKIKNLLDKLIDQTH